MESRLKTQNAAITAAFFRLNRMSVLGLVDLQLPVTKDTKRLPNFVRLGVVHQINASFAPLDQQLSN
ncbi:hypothetical protein [Pseudomonas sp. RC10]|uniref:hypothetical protein n=1 Tax=Pseudomonas bambusae TaxID=3139142 RepID=UPI0031392392